ncbi:MAG TPA: hypothetical protein VFG20_23855 [Planctomycetaceae bacterium]|nr:hypothetical protein [Planctomycetaceae bacterium]
MRLFAFRLGIAGCACLALALAVSGQEPSAGGLSPSTLAPGFSGNVIVTGGNLAGAKQLWLSFPAEAKLAEGIEGNGTKADQVVFAVTIPPTTAVGIHGLRVLTDKGVSPLRLVIVDDLPNQNSPGNNTTAAAAFALPAPCGVDGAVPNQGLQYFKFNAAENQRLAIEVLARRIGSPLDPMLRLLDARGRELAFSDDAPGLSGDSQLEYVFKAAGEYLLELRDIRYQGGAYRLRLGDFPCVNTPYPLAVQRSATTPVSLAGVGTAPAEAVPVTLPSDPALAAVSVSAKRPGGQSSGFATATVADRPQFLEQEPNTKPEEANRVDLTQDLNGRLETRGDIDRFIFAGKKDQSLVFTGITRTQGSPADLNLKLLNKDGGAVAQVDDTGTNEGVLVAKIPADGDYTLVVEDIAKRGGPNYTYRIAISPAVQPFTLAVSTDTGNVPVGGAISLTVTAARNGYAGPIELSAQGLPAGMTASRSVIGAGRNDAVLTLHAAPDQAASVLHGLKIIGTAKVGEADTAVTADFAGALKGRLANMRFPPATLTNDFAAAASPAAPLNWKVDPPEIVFGKELSAKVKLTATRGEGIDEAVTVAVQPPQNGLPAGITAAVKNIDKGASEVEIVFSATKDAPLGDFTAALVGTHKKGDKTVTVPAAIRLKLDAPLTVSLDPGTAKIAKGGELVIKAKVARNPALAGPVVIALQNLPKGVTAPEATIPPEGSEIEVKLTAAADSAVGAINNLAAKAAATVGNSKFEATSANVNLTVE